MRTCNRRRRRCCHLCPGADSRRHGWLLVVVVGLAQNSAPPISANASWPAGSRRRPLMAAGARPAQTSRPERSAGGTQTEHLCRASGCMAAAGRLLVGCWLAAASWRLARAGPALHLAGALQLASANSGDSWPSWGRQQANQPTGKPAGQPTDRPTGGRAHEPSSKLSKLRTWNSELYEWPRPIHKAERNAGPSRLSAAARASAGCRFLSASTPGAR